MASDKNQIEIEGNMVRDPILKSTGNGTPICTFSIATNRYFKKGDGFEKETSFFDVQTWGAIALVVDTKKKGQAVSIQGRLKQESWIDKNTGQNRSRILIVANNIEFITRNNGNSGISHRSARDLYNQIKDDCPF